MSLKPKLDKTDSSCALCFPIMSFPLVVIYNTGTTRNIPVKSGSFRRIASLTRRPALSDCYSSRASLLGHATTVATCV